MKGWRKWFLLLAAFFAGMILLVIIALPYLNSYQEKGVLKIPGLKGEVKVLRDEKGMAYIYAGNTEDAFLAQGFITAQDRLFQIEVTKLYAAGRIGELVGAKGEALDTRMRTIGFHRQGRRQAEILNPQNRMFFQKYLDGVNAYIHNFSREHPLEFRLAGIQPSPWDLSESLALLFLMSWNSAANLETEIIAQVLVEKLGPEKAREIFPLNINPDDPRSGGLPLGASPGGYSPGGFSPDARLLSLLEDRPLHLGSNNWAAGPDLSPEGKPIVANDPHLDARVLPGPWYPCALITPDFRMVGAGIPGIPGFVLGRNEHIALGVTNAYGDAQDLYIETVDPDSADRYLEGKAAFPFEVITEKLAIKDPAAPSGKRLKEIKIRLTRRGPVVSEVFPELKTQKVVSLRWAPFETMSPNLGLDAILTARNAEDLRQALAKVNFIMLNFVFADQEGNLGWIASGRLPIRSPGDGTVPFAVTEERDNWVGWIPPGNMPQLFNPTRGWLGTCNHATVGKDYPYYYSSHLSPSYRYRRLIELLDRPGKKSAEDHWRFQRDTRNLLAVKIAPLMVKALGKHADTKDLAAMLEQWNFHDDPDLAAPTLFQAIYREFAFQVFKDELGENPARIMLRNWYFWQERLQQFILEGKSSWFDDLATKDKVEDLEELFHRAAVLTVPALKAALGNDPAKWFWGKAHPLDFVSPVRREGIGKEFLGGGSHPFPGSGETLHRGIYDFSNPFAATTTASLRMVADLADDDKVLAVLPGGISGRLFHPHYKDQINAFISGEKVYWWFSDRAIRENAKTTLFLQPG